jgi:DNA-binding transcriptional regulator GbsR (MarR family)
MEERLGLSKAAVSIAARDLEKLGLVQRVWRPNDRKSYYRTVENLGLALRHGVLRQIESSMMDIENVLGKLHSEIEASDSKLDPDRAFLLQRLHRAEELQNRSKRMLNSPLLKLLVR